MSFSVNHVILVGHITKEIELSKTPSGQSVANIFVATNRGIKKAGQWTDKPTFIKVVVWARTAEFAKANLKVGDRLYVEGRLETEVIENPETKTKKILTEVIAENIIPMQKKEGAVAKTQDEAKSA